MDQDEQRLFADSLRQSIGRHGNDAVDAALAEVGWRSALADDPGAATRVVFGLLGELNLASSAIDDLLSFSLGLEPSDDRAVVLPALCGHTPPATYDRAELTISGLATARLDTAPTALVVIDASEQAYLATVNADAIGVVSVAGIDPDGRWRSVRGQVKVSGITVVRWNDAVASGQLALAQQLTSAARAMLELAKDHALTRNQFERPIASFQAVRHKLAESLVAVDSAEAALAAGWADPTPFAGTMAKAIAGNAAKTVAKHAQQVLAGMGFTSDHTFHRYLKRTLVLDQLLGSSAVLRTEIGQAIIETRQVPALLPL
jgi:hypothetical protein